MPNELMKTLTIGANTYDLPQKTSDLTNDSGFIITESDPVFTASAAHGIASTDITNWNNKISEPASEGTNGQVLMTNGNGTRTWGSVSTADEKVKLTSQSTSGNYPLIFGPTSITSNSTYQGYYNTGITINPSTKAVTATTFVGALTGTASGNLTSSSTLDASKLSGAIPSAVTATTQTSTDNSTKIATTAFVKTAIDNLPEPMVFKGSLGTGGTITSLPAASTSNTGYTYKVITAGTYASQSAKIGDTFISDGSAWILIPSGDEPSGTVTSVTLKATSPINIDSTSAITTSGTRTLSHADSGVTAGTYKSVTVDSKGHVTAGSNPSETDPVFTASAAYGISSSDITNWNGKTSNTGTVTSVRVQATSPVTSSTSTAQSATLNTTIALADGYGDTKNPYASKTKNYVLAAPSNANGVPGFRALVANDIPSLTVSKISDFPTIPTKTSDLTNDSGFLTSFTETDPTVPSWAKASTKPSYIASEVGAAASSHTHGNITNSGDITTNATIASGDRLVINDESASKVINSSITFGSSTTQYLANNGTWQNVPTVPTKTSDLTNDSGFITTESDPVFTASAAHGIASTDITNWNNKISEPTSEGTNGQVLTTDGNGGRSWEAVSTTDTKNTAGSTDTSSKIYLIGATSQSTNPQTYSHNTAYVGTDGHLYSNNTKVKVAQTAISSPSASGSATAFIDTISQDANGVITVTKKNLDTSGTWSGNATTATTASKLGSSDLGSATKPIYLASGTATECSTYAGGTAVTLNNSSKAASTASFYAPTAGGTQNTQALVGNGATAAPKWVNISPSVTVTAGTASAAPKINVTVLGQSGTAQSITTATTGLYGVTKLNSATNSTSTSEAATPSAVKSAYDLANNHKYWANIEATSAAAYNKTPEMATIKLNGNTNASAASTSNVTLVFDTVLQTLNFVFA